MINKAKFYITFFIASFVFFISCLDDVAHNNPIDPKNKNKGFSIMGKVTTLYAPVQNLPNAIITIQPGEQNLFSASDGSFEFNGLEPGFYTIFCTASGYSLDSIEVDLQSDQTINFSLDGLPYFEQTALTTHHISRFFPVDDLFLLEVNVKVNDPDGVSDIKQVYFDITEFDASDTLDASLETGRFTKRLSVDDLPINSIHSLIGRAFYISIMDDANKITVSNELFLTRIIDLTPVLEGPANLETVVGDSIDFLWQKNRLPFLFTHRIEIFQINFGLLTKVDEFNNIPSNISKWNTAHNLPNGDYVWILTIIDEFGNTSSSKEGTFNVSK